MSRYAKSIAALIGAVGTWGATAAQDGINSVEWFGLLTALGTVLAVWGVPNTPPAGQAADPGMSEQHEPSI